MERIRKWRAPSDHIQLVGLLIHRFTLLRVHVDYSLQEPRTNHTMVYFYHASFATRRCMT
jgi:hypothetical protein